MFTIKYNIREEKRLLKFIWSIINSENRIVNNVFKFVLNNRRSVLGENFRYLNNIVLGIKIGHILIVVFPILYQTVIIKMYL